MIKRTVLQQITTDLKKHLLDLESHASLLKKQIFKLEKQTNGLKTEVQPATVRATVGGGTKPCSVGCEKRDVLSQSDRSGFA